MISNGSQLGKRIVQATMVGQENSRRRKRNMSMPVI
jgi:hypothetical protein